MRRVFVVDPSLFTIPYAVALCKGLSDAGLDVALFGRSLRESEILGPTRFPLVPFFYRKTDQRRSLGPARLIAKSFEYLLDALRFVLTVRRQKPDIVHVQWSAIPLVDAFVFKLLRRSTKVVLTVHDSEPFNGRASSSLQMLGYDKLLGSADALIVHTADAKARLEQRGLDKSRISIVSHGLLGDVFEIPEKDSADNPCGKIRILLFGRLKPYKGLDVLVEAIGQLPADMQARLDVVVAGETFYDITAIKARAFELNLAGCLDIREGYVSDEKIASLIQTADLLVFPYRQIDASGVLFMAMSHRKPILASRMGAFADIVTDYGNGLLVEPNDPGALAGALKDVLQKPHLLPQLVASAVAIKLDRFSWDAVAQDTIKVYDSIRLQRPFQISEADG